MTPWQLANTSELSQQTALFCFTAKATEMGFKHAKDHHAYLGKSYQNAFYPNPVPELAFFHAIPNGVRSGDVRSRTIEGGRLRGAGVKAGVLDTFWPLPRGKWHGLYIEMKAEKGVLSKEQIAFGNYADSVGYCCKVCYSWIEAAEALEWYYNLEKPE